MAPEAAEKVEIAAGLRRLRILRELAGQLGEVFAGLGARLNGLVEVADLAADHDFALRRGEVAGDELDHGGLSGAIVAHQPHNLAGFDCKAHVAQRLDGAEMCDSPHTTSG